MRTPLVAGFPVIRSRLRSAPVHRCGFCVLNGGPSLTILLLET
jgi:hypothetical protein